MSSKSLQASVSDSVDQAFADLVERLTARLQAGEELDEHLVLAEHPEHAERLCRLLPALRLMAGLSERSGELSASQAGEPLLTGTLGDFRLLREAGRGGMAVVYEAEQISLGRRVALKVLPFAATMDPRHLARFHNEARAAACLHHEHIVPVYAVGSERGVHFYAMQFIEGRTLAALVHQLRQQAGLAAPPAAAVAVEPASPEALTTPHVPGMTSPAAGETAALAGLSTERTGRGKEFWRTVARLGVQAAEALEHAHERGIVHRDVKPGNLLLDDRGSVWVTDFGLAHLQHGEGSLTLTGDLLGTLRYMSPEQAAGQRGGIDHRSDVYSLGATLYELLTLRPAFDGQDRQELLRQVTLEGPAAPRKLDRGIPAELETIVLKALEKNPADRYATAKELADDLRRWLEDQPIQARRPSLRQVAAKWARRHRAAVTAAAVCLVVSLAALAGSLGWVLRDAEARRVETAAREGEIERAATADLDEAERHLKGERWPEVTQALQRVEGRLATGGPVYVREQVEQMKKYVAVVDRLERARMLASSHPAIEVSLLKGDLAYAAAFTEYGLDPLALPPAEAGDRIRDSAIRQQLVTALDEWFFIKERLRRGSGKSLQAVARLADDDPRRQRLRDLLARQDVDALECFAFEQETLALPPSYLILLAQILAERGRGAANIGLLRRGQRRYPRNFWLNAILGAAMMKSAMAQGQAAMMEVAGFLRVALTIRPQAPHTMKLLGRMLRATGQSSEAEDVYREAIALDPHDFPAWTELGVALSNQGKFEEAIAAHRRAIRLEPDFLHAHNNLGFALWKKGQLDEAITAFRKAIRLRPDYPEAHINLGAALKDKGRLDEAIAAYREALRLKKDHAEAYNNLGVALAAKGRLDEAIAAYREAIRLKPDLTWAHNNLGNAMKDKGRLDEAIAAFREAIRLRPAFAMAHSNLGIALAAKGQVDEAIAAFREAIRLKPDFAKAHYNLGTVLAAKGQLDEAIAACREAIRLKKDYADAHNNLGVALKAKGKVDEAIACYRQAIRLNKNYANAHHNLRVALRYKRLLDRLPAILAGKDQPKDAAERTRFAHFCQQTHQQRYATAARFYTEAFAEQPALAANLQAAHRYNAACAAALAGCGQGKDAASLGPMQRLHWRRQALTWLQADLRAWQQLLAGEPIRARPVFIGQMQHWLKDPDFAGVRGPDALAKLPEAERLAWHNLWAAVADTLTRASQATASKKQPDQEELLPQPQTVIDRQH
jgi:tetratricopeptide (TPR) repeat protein/serine/threonine protein kinase